MKATLVMLLAMTSMAHAAWFNVTGSDGSDFFAHDGTNYTMFGDGYGNPVPIESTVKSELTSTEHPHNLNFGTADGGSAAPSIAINDSLSVTQIHTTRATELKLNFGAQGSLSGSGVFDISDTVTSITVSATLTDEEIYTLQNPQGKEMVSRTLIRVDCISGEDIHTLASMLHLGTLTGYDTTYGGVLYSVTVDGVTTYYNLSDVTTSGSYGTTYYVDVKEGAQAFTPVDNHSYLVIGGAATKGAAMKTISYLAAVPEPTTATLSLLALAGLAVRRRRK